MTMGLCAVLLSINLKLLVVELGKLLKEAKVVFVILCKYISFRGNNEIIGGGQSVLPFSKNILYFI